MLDCVCDLTLFTPLEYRGRAKDSHDENLKHFQPCDAVNESYAIFNGKQDHSWICPPVVNEDLCNRTHRAQLDVDRFFAYFDDVVTTCKTVKNIA
jgi:hypothetical protein